MLRTKAEIDYMLLLMAPLSTRSDFFKRSLSRLILVFIIRSMVNPSDNDNMYLKLDILLNAEIICLG